MSSNVVTNALDHTEYQTLMANNSHASLQRNLTKQKWVSEVYSQIPNTPPLLQCRAVFPWLAGSMVH